MSQQNASNRTPSLYAYGPPPSPQSAPLYGRLFLHKIIVPLPLVTVVVVVVLHSSPHPPSLTPLTPLLP